jgi:uncharacterized protein YjbI with pentapeptide repeats
MPAYAPPDVEYSGDEEQRALLRRAANEDPRLWNSWRAKNPEVAPALRGVELPGAELAGVDLTKANLFGAKLQDANLRRAKLSGCGLQ